MWLLLDENEEFTGHSSSYRADLEAMLPNCPDDWFICSASCYQKHSAEESVRAIVHKGKSGDMYTLVNSNKIHTMGSND